MYVKERIVNMYCIHCGRLNHNKICLFSEKGVNYIHSFFVSNLLFNSKFNKVYCIYPTSNQYNLYSSLMNLPDTLEIESLYNEDWIDILLMIVSGINDINVLLNHLLFPSIEENTIIEEEGYFNDLDFNKKNKIERQKLYEKLKLNTITYKTIKHYTGQSLLDLEELQ